VSISHNWVSFFGAKLYTNQKYVERFLSTGRISASISRNNRQANLFVLLKKPFAKVVYLIYMDTFVEEIEIFLQFLPIVNCGYGINLEGSNCLCRIKQAHYMPLASDRWAYDHISFITFMFDWEVSWIPCHTITFRNYNSLVTIGHMPFTKLLNSFPYQVAQPLSRKSFGLFCSDPQMFPFFQFCDVVNRDNLPYDNLAKFGYKHYTNVKLFQHPSHFCYMH
jgi:hypothetical protein